MRTTTQNSFEKEVTTKFNIYNSLFLNLPYRKVSNIGMLIPILLKESQQGLEEGKNPSEILAHFFEKHTELSTEGERIDFMFKVVQYVERQVVLYDSVEDAAFVELHKQSTNKTISDFLKLDPTLSSKEDILQWLSDFSVRIVFTAHPTQFYSPAVLDIIAQLRSLIRDNHLGEIDTTLQQLGLTSLINTKKPTPIDEAKNIIYYLRNVYYDAIGDFYSQFQSVLSNEELQNHNIIKLGFWPCGDRDGNPFVTAESTKQVADELRTTLMKCYYNEVKALQKKLSFRKIEEPMQNLRAQLYDAMFDSSKTLPLQDIQAPLLHIREILTEDYHGIYLAELDKLINKVSIFKTHFASLDIRQDHSVHHKAVLTILKKEGVIEERISELSENEIDDILLSTDIDATKYTFDDPLIQDTIVNIAQLKDI